MHTLRFKSGAKLGRRCIYYEPKNIINYPDRNNSRTFRTPVQLHYYKKKKPWTKTEKTRRNKKDKYNATKYHIYPDIMHALNLKRT